MSDLRFWDDSIDKQLKIEYDGGAIGNEQIETESMELEERLCSEKALRFGGCAASIFKIRILNNVVPLKGKVLMVSMTLQGEEPFPLGRYRVESDQPTADRKYRDVVAFDARHTILHADVADWYNGLTFPLTLKAFRDSFFAWFGIEQETATLINDSMTVEETIKPSQLSGRTVITAICEINGCFGNIGRDGTFKYITLPKIDGGLYPSEELYPSEDLYPSNGNVEEMEKHRYIQAAYEDFVTQPIGKLQIRKEEGDIGAIIGTGDNTYIIQDNFLLYGKSDAELQVIGGRILDVIKDVSYRPCNVESKGNPALEVGQPIQLFTTNQIVESYILQRNLKGIQALKDTYTAEGTETYSEKLNGLREEIIQLKGKTNTLVRTVEETRLEIADIEQGLSSQIIANAGLIAGEVTRATNAEGVLSGRIQVTETAIALKVSKGEVSSQLSVESGQVTISSNRFVLNSTNCSISADGTITAKNGTFSGTITSSNAVITGGRINMTSANEDSGVLLVAGTSNTHMTGNGLILRNTYGTTTIGGNYLTVGGALTVNGNILVNNIQARSGSSITLQNNVSFSGDTEFSSTKTHTFKGKTSIENTFNVKGTYGDNIYSSSAIVRIATTSGTLGFFGATGGIKRSVSNITSPSSATATDCAVKINELLTAIKAYGLIG